MSKLHDGIWLAEGEEEYPVVLVLGGRKVNGYRGISENALFSFIQKANKYTTSTYLMPSKANLLAPEEFFQ